MDDWLTPDVAAALLGVTRANVKVIAHRDRWRRLRTGRTTAYWTADVTTTAERRTRHRAPRATACATAM